jgi:outer membrane receptor for Fe3+-dicitrate
MDIEASYRMQMLGGRFSTRLLATHLYSYALQGSAGAAKIEYAGNADFADVGIQPFPMPKWRGTLELTYANGPFSVGVQERYIGSYDRSKLFVYRDNHIGAVAYTDLNASYDIKAMGGTLQVFTTVNNLFDRSYPITPIGSNPGLAVSTFRSTYDVTGRYYTAGVRFRF